MSYRKIVLHRFRKVTWYNGNMKRERKEKVLAEGIYKGGNVKQLKELTLVIKRV